MADSLVTVSTGTPGVNLSHPSPTALPRKWMIKASTPAIIHTQLTHIMITNTHTHRHTLTHTDTHTHTHTYSHMHTPKGARQSGVQKGCWGGPRRPWISIRYSRVCYVCLCVYISVFVCVNLSREANTREKRACTRALWSTLTCLFEGLWQAEALFVWACVRGVCVSVCRVREVTGRTATLSVAFLVCMCVRVWVWDREYLYCFREVVSCVQVWILYFEKKHYFRLTQNRNRTVQEHRSMGQ